MKGKEKGGHRPYSAFQNGWLTQIYILFSYLSLYKNSLGRVHHEAQVYENINITRDLF